jgi:ATP-binding cassette, subfamily B (MDR/TAP), member 1
MAEEVISTIRTAQAFGTQNTLSAIYAEHIEKAKIFDARAAIWNGGGMAVFFFFIYSVYSLAFYFGVTLINDGHGESFLAYGGGVPFSFSDLFFCPFLFFVASAGVVINVVMSILIGSLSLGILAPEMQGKRVSGSSTHNKNLHF